MSAASKLSRHVSLAFLIVPNDPVSSTLWMWWRGVGYNYVGLAAPFEQALCSSGLASWLAMGTQTAAGLRDAWAMCICTRPSLDTSVMALITAFRVAHLAKHASSSHSVWQSWRLTSTPMTFQAVLVADWRCWLDLCTDAVSTWWSWRVVGFEHGHQGRSADKARADR